MSQPQPALLLAAHGAARPQALAGVSNVAALARRRFPSAEVRLAFTSGVVRRLLAKRATAEAASAFPGPLLALAQLQEQGFGDIVVQPLHIFAGAEFMDLAAMVRALAGIATVDAAHAPFGRLALGRPALGQPGPLHPYLDDIARAAQALAGDVAMALAQDAALVYVGHGNRRFPTGVYQELQEILRAQNPGLRCLVGALDGVFGLEHARRALAHMGVGRVLLLPLLLVTGSHALDDICGQGAESWAGALRADGLEVQCLDRGLGQVDAWAALYLDHAADAAREAGFEL